MEYIFFDDGLSKRFAAFGRDLRIVCREKSDSMGIVIEVPDELDDETAEALEEKYDELMEIQAEMTDAAEPDQHHAAGVSITLSDGRPCMIRIEPEIMGRLMANFSVEEIHDLATRIARSAENPDNSPICHTLCDN